MATNYSRGRAWEYKVRDWFIEIGARYVIRAAGSHTAADLVVLWDKPLSEFGLCKVYLVQCKKDGKLPRLERLKLEDLAIMTGASAWVAKQGKRGQPPELELIMTGGA